MKGKNVTFCQGVKIRNFDQPVRCEPARRYHPHGERGQKTLEVCAKQAGGEGSKEREETDTVRLGCGQQNRRAVLSKSYPIYELPRRMLERDALLIRLQMRSCFSTVRKC